MLSKERSKALSEAVFEAERFVKRAKEALRDNYGDAYYSISRASARRSSLDLSRALAKWRQTK